MDLMSIRRRLLIMAAAVRRVLHSITSATGIVSFSTNLNEPVESLVCEFSPVQSGSGDPSPENIRPITGWNKINLHRYTLPPGYTPVEYVTIQQKITIDRFGTGFVNFGTNGLYLSCEWKSTIYKQYGAIYSSTYVNESTNVTRLLYRTANNAYIVNNNNRASNSYALYDLPQDTWHHIDSRYAKVTVDGTEYTSSGTQGTATTGTTFSLGWDGCNISFRQMDIHGHPYYNDTTPYLSLVPCTNPNNVAGFYDIVAGNFWTTPDSTKAQAHGTAYKIDHYGEDIIEVDWAATYRRLKDITFDGNVHYESTVHLIGSDVVTMTLTPGATSGMNVFGCYSGTGTSARNFSFFNYQSNSSNAYFRYGTVLLRPNWGTTATRTVSFGAGGTDGFRTDVSTPETEFTTTDPAWIGMLPNSSSSHFNGTITGSIKVGNRLEFIPTKRVSDGVIGYYDTLNKVFLEPVGTGTPTTSGYDETDPGTVYGGTLDVATGVLTVTHKLVTYDGTEGWGHSSSGTKHYFYVSTTSDIKVTQTPISNLFKGVENTSYGNLADGEFAMTNPPGMNYFNVRHDALSSAADFEAMLAQTPMTVVCKLVTPKTYQLTPQQVSTIIGSNTVWHDGNGAITVAYYDTH